MKKNLFYYLFALLCTVTMFTSCSNNEEPEKTIPAAKDLAGKYKGALNVSISQGETEIPGGTIDPQFITVSNSGDNAVSLSITDFSFMGIEIGDINLNDCVLTANGDAYDFTGITTVETSLLTADVDALGSFNNGTLTLNLDIDALVGGSVEQKVKVTYSGTRLSGNESSEAKILSFTFDKNEAANSIVVSDPVISEEEKTITFLYAGDATAEQLAALVPTIQVSEGAAVDPANGVAQDFSQAVTYTVTAEDGITTAVYTVTATKQVITENVKYDFTAWVTESHTPILGSTKEYGIPEGWKTSNPGIVEMGLFAEQVGNPDWSVKKDDEAGDGVVMIQTQNTVGVNMVISKVPTVTAGSLFMGTWKTNMTNTLNSTKFGVQYDNAQGKPVQVKVRYKYESGKDYYTCPDGSVEKGTIDASRGEYADKFSIKVSLYTTDGYDENEYSDYLTGEAGEANFYTSSRVVSKGELVEGSTEGVWKEATIDLNDFELNVDQKYRFTIVCSSSYEGDKFYGAPGSKLWIDSMEIVYQR